MLRTALVIASLVAAGLAGCAGPDVPCCLRPDADAGCLTGLDLPLSATLSSRAVQFGATACARKVCVADYASPPSAAELKGYCTQQCSASVACSAGMECMQFASASADGGGALSACVHPTK